MSSEENYLDNLLNNVMPSETVEPMKEMQSDENMEINIDSLGMPDALDVEMPDVEMPDLEIPDLDLSDLEIPDIVMPDAMAGVSGETGILDLAEPEEPAGVLQESEEEPGGDVPGEVMTVEELLEQASFGEPSAEDNDRAADTGTVGELSSEDSGTEAFGMADQGIEDPGISDMGIPGMPDISDTGEEWNLEDIEMPESEDEFKLEDLGIPAGGGVPEDGLDIDGLDQAIQSETELQMAGELDINDLGFDNGDGETEVLALSDDSDIQAGMDDNLEDVLSMLDDDAELAEINDMLRKSDNNEPIQDDMMELLHQMADDEAASVNAGIHHTDDEDDGVPLPRIPQAVEEPAEDDDAAAKKGKKAAAKKKKRGKADPGEDAESTKEPGKLGKFFNMLTEDIVPEPTEEELAAEKEAKAAKKQENQTKKEEEKLAKAEAKKAKAEEKAAANRVKQEAAAQKKKEKQAKAAAKKAAKAAAEAAKKRIPPKKIAVAIAFGASVGGAVVLAANILSTQGFLQTARNAYYDGDYKAVYEATYGMELDDSRNDGLIKARSEVIFKIQQRYDSYLTNLKMGREVEALDSLLRGITVYDSVNADAEKYGVMAEVDAVRANILSALETEYGLDETEARVILNNQDALSYTIALNDVIAGN